MKTTTTKTIDREISKAWSRLASGVQVNVMDIPKIFRDARDLVSLGQSVDDAIRSLIPRYQQHPTATP